MPSHPSPNSGSKFQRGGALLVMLVILVMGITTVFVTSLSGTALQNNRNQTTSKALALAKEALISYAVGDPNRPGELPCPDIDGDGSADSCSEATNKLVGHLPWRTLDLPDPRDSSGEKLWYVVSEAFHANGVSAINSDTSGTISINGNTGFAAVIIAPGAPLPSQSRPAAPSNLNASSTYLQYLENITQTSIQTQSPNNIPAGAYTYNDQLLSLRPEDFIPLVEKRVAREVKKCLEDYANTPSGTPSNKYPWPAPITTGSYTGVVNTLFGRVADTPNINTGTTYTPTDPWEITMLEELVNLQAALDAYAASNTWSTRNTLDNTGDNLKDVADNIIDATSPAYSAGVVAVATPAKQAGRYAQKLADGDYRWNGTAWVLYTVSDVQQQINAANTALASLGASASPDPDMSSIWPTGCFDVATNPYWAYWKELAFYQVAEGYKPGSSAICDVSGTNTCLSMQTTDVAVNGTGTLRAIVIVAGRKLTANRVTTTVSDYLEPDNVTATGAPTANSFKTYRTSDTGYQTNNDRVLCVDGKVNCQ